MGTLAEIPELPNAGSLVAPNTDKATFQGKSENLNVFSMLKMGPKNSAWRVGGTGSEEGASIHFPRTAEPRGGSPFTRTVTLLVHAHFRPGPASLPPESVLGWKEIKRRQSNQKFSL